MLAFLISFLTKSCKIKKIERFKYSLEAIYNNKSESFNDRVNFVEQIGGAIELKNIFLAFNFLFYCFSYIYVKPRSFAPLDLLCV